MNQFTIQTTANATDFADLVNALQYASVHREQRHE